MKIQQVKIKEFKALRDIDENINGNNIFLIGDNGVGKSSFIQFIEIALGKNTNIPPNATGEGEIVTDKDGNKYIFQVKFKDNKPVVTVITPDGLKNKTKSALATVVGAMNFDIDQFVELSKSVAGRKNQIEIFKSFLSDEIKNELSKYENNIAANYENRTDLNRHIKEKEAIVNSNPLRNEIGITILEKINIEGVFEQLNEGKKLNTKYEEAKFRAVERQKSIDKRKSDIDKLIEEQECDIRTQSAAIDWLGSNKLFDLTELENKIKNASEINSKFDAIEKLKKDIALIEVMKAESGDLTALIESEKSLIEETIKDMQSPIEGLSYDETQLVYNGIPVNPDSLSTSEIMELGVKLKMAENPDLGILFIEKGESLGAKRLADIQEMAAKSGWQIIMEQVERGTEQLKIEIMS